MNNDISLGMFHNITGLQVIEDPYMLETKEEIKTRTWKERLFSLPWQPLRKTETVYTQTPRQDYLIFQDKLICHPDIANVLRNAIKLGFGLREIQAIDNKQ